MDEIGEHFEAIENMNIRDDDVVLLTYPKSGKTLNVQGSYPQSKQNI